MEPSRPGNTLAIDLVKGMMFFVPSPWSRRRSVHGVQRQPVAIPETPSSNIAKGALYLRRHWEALLS